MGIIHRFGAIIFRYPSLPGSPTNCNALSFAFPESFTLASMPTSFHGSRKSYTSLTYPISIAMRTPGAPRLALTNKPSPKLTAILRIRGAPTRKKPNRCSKEARVAFLVSSSFETRPARRSSPLFGASLPALVPPHFDNQLHTAHGLIRKDHGLLWQISDRLRSGSVKASHPGPPARYFRSTDLSCFLLLPRNPSPPPPIYCSGSFLSRVRNPEPDPSTARGAAGCFRKLVFCSSSSFLFFLFVFLVAQSCR